MSSINNRAMSLDEALEFLGVCSDTDSDSIEAMAQFLQSEGGDKAKIAQVLRVVAEGRGDLILQRAASAMEPSKTEDEHPVVQGHSQGLSLFLAQLAGAHDTENKEIIANAQNAFVGALLSEKKIEKKRVEVKKDEKFAEELGSLGLSEDKKTEEETTTGAEKSARAEM